MIPGKKIDTLSRVFEAVFLMQNQTTNQIRLLKLFLPRRSQSILHVFLLSIDFRKTFQFFTEEKSFTRLLEERDVKQDESSTSRSFDSFLSLSLSLSVHTWEKKRKREMKTHQSERRRRWKLKGQIGSHVSLSHTLSVSMLVCFIARFNAPWMKP